MNNIHGLPAPLVKALTFERRRPVPGRFGVTALIDSPLKRLLAMRHFDEVEDEVSENFWAFLGKMGHRVLEDDSETSEVKIEVDLWGGKVVGVIDYHKDGKITDWKFTSVWAAMFIKDKSEWELQLQIYAYLLQLIGKPVFGISNFLLLRDWNKREAQKNQDYPRIPFKKIEYSLWDAPTIEAYVHGRIDLHLDAERFHGDIPEKFWCSPEERWHKPDKWAVMKKKDGRAVRVLENKEAAEIIRSAESERTNINHFIVFRPGEDTKCASYCSYNKWCPYWREHGTINEGPVVESDAQGGAE
jgi:hypothetical protein